MLRAGALHPLARNSCCDDGRHSDSAYTLGAAFGSLNLRLLDAEALWEEWLGLLSADADLRLVPGLDSHAAGCA